MKKEKWIVDILFILTQTLQTLKILGISIRWILGIFITYVYAINGMIITMFCSALVTTDIFLCSLNLLEKKEIIKIRKMSFHLASFFVYFLWPFFFGWHFKWLIFVSKKTLEEMIFECLILLAIFSCVIDSLGNFILCFEKPRKKITDFLKN